MTTYHYTASRKSDGVEIHSGTIDDLADAGMGSMAGTIRAGLIASHPLAAGLSDDDIDISMRLA